MTDAEAVLAAYSPTKTTDEIATECGVSATVVRRLLAGMRFRADPSDGTDVAATKSESGVVFGPVSRTK